MKNTRKTFAFLLLLMMLTLAFGSAAQTPGQSNTEKSTSEIYKAASDAVVRIEILDANGNVQKSGSGFFISEDGRLLTNHHVIEGGGAAIVRLSSGGMLPVLGILADNPDRDLAILKVAGTQLPHLRIAGSPIEVGEKVIAIGSPLGLQNSVSEGIVSGLREIGNASWIQTTASVSPGNSGGPLLAANGDVVGVVTAKLVGGENLNFAIPIDAASKLSRIESLVALADMKFSSTTVALPDSKVWTSLISGRDFRVRLDGDYVYAEWVNLPNSLTGTSAFMRSELKKEGSNWRGTARSFLPYRYIGNQVKWCSLAMPIEITSMSSTRIEGTAMGSTKVDARHCRIDKPEQQAFTWIPKEP